MGSFDETRNKLLKKYNVNNSNNNSSVTHTTVQPVEGTTFDETRKRLREKYLTDKTDISGVNKWFSDATNAMKSMSHYNNANKNKFVANYGGDAGANIDKLLNSSVDVYNYLLNHKDEFDNYDEIDSQLSEYRKALMSYDINNFNLNKYYSQFENEDDYNAYLLEYDRQQKYSGKSYSDIKGILSSMNDSDEKEWLKNYSTSIMTIDDYTKAIAEKEAEIEELKERDAQESNKRNASALSILPTIKSYATKTAEHELETLKNGKWALENKQKYDDLKENKDYKENSTKVADSPTFKFGIGNWDIIGDSKYDYINDIDGAREKEYNKEVGSVDNTSPMASELYKYSFMDDSEIAQYNYLYNTEGKKAANEYLDYLSYELDSRRTQKLSADSKEYATKHPVLASISRVPVNLVSGAGLIDVAVQNITSDIKESVTGEFTPINYNNWGMSPTVQASSITSTVAENIANKTGVIELDENKHPVLSRVLNGKSLGDVYQLGMSMVDSAATAALAPFIGGAGTILLGGSAGSQGILDALEKGATDEQALWMGLLNGTFEALFEYVSLDKLMSSDAKNIIVGMLKQGFIEGTEELSTTFANNVADLIVMAEKSDYRSKIDTYKSAGMSEEKATAQALIDTAIDMGWDFVGGAISGGVMGGIHSGINNVTDTFTNIANGKNAKNIYGTDLAALVNEALEIDPDNKLAQKLQSKLDNGQNISGYQINKLVQQNEAAIAKLDRATIQENAKNRLLELGETTNVDALAAALTKQTIGEELTLPEQRLISTSLYGERVSNELNTDNINSGNYSTAWSESLGTSRINADEYNRLVEAAQLPQKAHVQETNKNIVKTSNVTQSLTQPTTSGEFLSELSNTESTDIEIGNALTLEDASEKYGAQAGAMLHTYNDGQDIAKYDSAYKIAYDMGESSVAFSYVQNSEATNYLTDTQKELAYEAGKAAATASASARDSVNKQNINGNTVRKEGVVRGEGISLNEIMDTFNDTQKLAYKSLSTIAKATGIDIVLYKSDINESGDFVGSQGKFKNSEDTIYIDINAGLKNINNIDDLAKYSMLRTFAHEFTHFIEKWSPVQYNEFRTVVFDTLTEHGVDVDERINLKQGDNLTYEQASREVVAEAMTDVLPDSTFVQELAEKHQNIFQKLLEKLKEFVQDIKTYFGTIGENRSVEANALKEQIGDTVRYVENIVKMFDEIAVQSVENYQATVASQAVVAENATTAEETPTVTEETTTENAQNTSTEDSNEPVSITDELGFTITDNVQYGSLEISFDNKPSDTVRNVLKSNRFRWNKTKKVWYGYADRATITDALRSAYNSETVTQDISNVSNEFENTPQIESAEVIESINKNVGEASSTVPMVTHEAMPTENIKEEVKNGENVDNQGTVRQSDTDRQRDTRILDEVEAADVQGDVQRGNSLGDTVERRQETGRADNNSDTSGTGRRSGEGNSESTDLRRNDGLTAETDKAAKKLREEVTEQIKRQSTPTPKGSNFVIGDTLDLPNGEKARYKANVDAIKLVKELQSQGRFATPEEQAILSKYVGWGGLSNVFNERDTKWTKEYSELKELLTNDEYSLARGSTLNAHYTDISVIKAMYDGLSSLGFDGGRMLEPSAGVGNFVGAMPAAMSSKVKSWTMVELDGITGTIAKYLYPNADVRIQGFEKANIPDNYMDVAISNVPFGNYAITDKAYPKSVTSSIHNYFFAKALDKVRPGGILMFITSRYTMDSENNAVRRYIMNRADLLGAIRLPETAFKSNAGTEVVTDIIVLKKRAANTNYTGIDFLDSPRQYISGYGMANINNYFVQHPEMVLGTVSATGSMYRNSGLTYEAFTDKGSLADQIREAFNNIDGTIDYPTTLSPEKSNFAVERATKNTKNNGLISKDGKIYKNENGELVEHQVSDSVAKRITGLLEIRDAARELQNYQQQGLKASEIKKARLKLNQLYDNFVKKNGYINSQTNKNAISNDPDRYSIFALENWDSDTKTATKADIFSKNTISPNRTITSAKDISEGLIVSVNQTGGIDTSLIAQLTGKSEIDVTKELIDSRQAFKNRDGQLETAEVYLSGNVRAKLRDAEALVSIDSDYTNNVEALKKVIPADIDHRDIYVNPGAVWIPPSVYSDFAAHMLGVQNYTNRNRVDIAYNKATGNFTVSLNDYYLKNSAANTQQWGTNRRSFIELFDAMLNNKSVVIKNKLEDGSIVVDNDATAAANEKIENITKEFQNWLWQDETRTTELSTLYNETYNAVVTPTYDGKNLTVNGSNAMKPLRPHQQNAVQRVISSGGNTLLAHKVGAGKTYEMAASAMKLKQLGLVNKPMFAVPKSLVAQWGSEFIDFFPTARLLVAEETDFKPANRKTFMNRIATGDYDAVIVSYEQFEKLPISDDFSRGLYQEELDTVIRALEEAKAEKGGKSLSVKDLEKKRKALQAKIDKLTDSAKDTDNISFEQLGIDSLFIDEAHNFKNLFYTTSMTNVSGLGNKDGSKRAFDLYTKVRYLQKLNGGRGIVFATATPVMNSMSEMYIMQKYLQPDLLDQLGLSTFDAWAKQFGEVVNGVEIKPSGQGYRVKQSFSKFKNMNELQLLFRNFADVLTNIPGLKIPKMRGGQVQVVVCEAGEYQKNFMKELESRADNIKNVDPSEDNMLKITSDGRKISYTQRMIDPSLPYEEGCKIFRCADNVIEVYNESNDVKGTQLIFCDMATPKGRSKVSTSENVELDTDMESARLYDDIKVRLIQGGIPANEIAFIHEADTDSKKKKLYADVNKGKVRVLIGSTSKMGVGMNAQERVVAIHHLDAPWRPGDVEQRNGRAFRQGNINDEVWNFTYVTEGTFDARLWDIIDRKQNFINQIMNGENIGREVEDTVEVTLSAAEVKALASGSPLIMEQVQLDTDIKKLESLRRTYNSSIRNAQNRLTSGQSMFTTLENQIANGKADISSRVDTYSDDNFSVTIGNKNYTDKKAAGAALMAAAKSKAKNDGYTTIGKFAGFDLRVVNTHEGIKGLISGNQGYSFNTYPNNTTYMINHLIAQVEGMEEAVKGWEQQLANVQQDILAQEQIIAQPFEKQSELDQKRARYNEVMAILNPKEEQSLYSMDEDTEQHQSREYLEDELPKKYNKRSKWSETETSFLSWSNGFAPIGETKRFFRFGKMRFYEKTESGCIELSASQYDERMNIDGSYIDRRAEREISEAANYDGNSQRGQTDNNQRNRNTGGTSEISKHSFGEQLRNDTAGSTSGGRGSNSQYQQRTDTLTDRELLSVAAEQISILTNLTDGERDALNIFQKRLDKLSELQERRKEYGKQYRQQQFGTKVDRTEAAKTLNRMHILDDQIKRASTDVLSIEDKAVLKRVLKEARSVVEQQDKLHEKETLKRWRDKRNNSEAIKKYRTRIQNDVNTLSNWIIHPDNKNALRHIPDALKQTVIPFLSSINFESKRSLRGGAYTQADIAFKERLEKLKASYKEISVDDLYSGYYDLAPDFMDNLQLMIDKVNGIIKDGNGEYVINQMTSDELRTLSKIVSNLKEQITRFNKFHVNQMFEYAYEAGDNSIDSMREMRDASTYTNGVTDFVFWQQIRPAYAFERFGKGGVAIYDGFRRGQSTLAFNTKQIIEFAEKTYTDKEVKAWEKALKNIELSDGSTITLPVSSIMSFYELSKRPQALNHMLVGGVRAAAQKTKGKAINTHGHMLTEADIQTIVDTLTPRQKEVADSLQKYMAEQGGKWGNYVTVKRFGEEMFGEPTYFPIQSDGRHLRASADGTPNNATLYSLLNMSFTKELNEKANNRIVLYSIFDVFANHMASMAQYNAFALPMLDALKWFNYQQKVEKTNSEGKKYYVTTGTVREEMARAYGAPTSKNANSELPSYAETFVTNILKAFNGTEAQGSRYDSTGLKMLNRYNRAQIAFNLRVVMQQPTAITRAGLILDPDALIKGIGKPTLKQNIEEMQKYSGIAVWKDLGFYDVNGSRGLTDMIKHADGFVNKTMEYGTWGAEKADLVTWAAMWSAAKEQVTKKQHLTPKSPGFYEAVTNLFEDVIYKTQVVDSVLTKNAFLRSKGLFARTVGSFMSEPTTTASMLIDAYDKYHSDIQRGMNRTEAWKKHGRMIGRTVAVFAIGAMINAFAQSISDGFRDDDDYQTYPEKWWEAFKGNVIDELMPFNKLPVVSDFYDIAKTLVSYLGVDTYGYAPQSVYMQWYDILVKGAEIITDHIFKEDTNYTWYGGVYKLLQAASGITGLPMAAATREAITIWNNTLGAMAPSLKVKTYDPGDKKEIQYAYQDGYLTADEATQLLLQKELVDSEDDAYWSIQSWDSEEDNYSRYGAIYEAVLSGTGFDEAMAELTSHGYKEKEVLSQVKSQIGKWYRDGEITKQQASTMLSKYLELSTNEISETIATWSCAVDTGIPYNDIKDEYLAGNITFNEAVSMRVKYGGEKQEEATETVTKWQCEKDTGIAYEDAKDEFMDGNISATELKDIYMTYGGKDEDDAEKAVAVATFVKKHPEVDGISYSAVEAYTKYGESSGISAKDFYEIYKYCNTFTADYDEDGNAISGSKKAKILEYINNQPLTIAQKDSLYYAFGYAESKLYQAPWH